MPLTIEKVDGTETRSWKLHLRLPWGWKDSTIEAIKARGKAVTQTQAL